MVFQPADELHGALGEALDALLENGQSASSAEMRLAASRWMDSGSVRYRRATTRLMNAGVSLSAFGVIGVNGVRGIHGLQIQFHCLHFLTHQLPQFFGSDHRGGSTEAEHPALHLHQLGQPEMHP